MSRIRRQSVEPEHGKFKFGMPWISMLLPRVGSEDFHQVVDILRLLASLSFAYEGFELP